MPTYEFKNTETDEVFEKFMSYDDKVKFLEDNPHIKTYYSKGPNVDFDGGQSVLSRAGDGWKEVQSVGATSVVLAPHARPYLPSNC